jgi:hypothetical protein
MRCIAGNGNAGASSEEIKNMAGIHANHAISTIKLHRKNYTRGSMLARSGAVRYF